MMFLTAENLRDLTGYLKPALQIRWLMANRWRLAVRADGKPVVAIAEMERHLCGPQVKTADAEPNLAGLDSL